MNTVSLIFLAVFTAWAARVVARDMATRKIPNASVLAGAKLIAAGIAAAALYTWLGHAGRVQSFLNANFYLLFAVHVFWSAAAGVILWYAEVWPAGDAKFFMLVSAALPLADPYLRGFPNYLFLNLLINIFVAAAFWAVGGYLASGFTSVAPADFFAGLRDDVKRRFGELAGGRNRAAAALLVVNMGFLFLLQQVLSMEARGFVSRFFSRADILFFFMFILWDKVGAAFASRRWAVFSGVCYALYFLLGFLLFRERLLALLAAAGMNVLKFSLLLFVGRFMLEFLMEKKDTVSVTAAELEPGMVLSSASARTLRGNPVFDGLFEDCFKDGLTDEQSEALKGWLTRLPVRDPKIEIVRGRPFALWIFAGAALLLTLGRSIAGFFR